ERRRSERSSPTRERNAVEDSAIPEEMQQRINNSLELLRNIQPTVGTHNDASPFELDDPCTPISRRIGPQYQFTYRLPFELATPCTLARSNNIELACVTISTGSV